MPAALLDTNAVSDLMRDHPKVKARTAQHPGPITSSVVAVGEIRYGLNRLPPGRKRSDLEARATNILAALRIEPVTEVIDEAYGRLKASLEALGLVAEDNDLWIAATAFALGSVLVSRDQIFDVFPGCG
jgi:predicted nucleic acid-binding protein